MIEGSGSRRPKKWIQWIRIRIRIRNTGFWFWLSPFLPIHSQPKALPEVFGFGFLNHKRLYLKFKMDHGSITEEQCCGSGRIRIEMRIRIQEAKEGPQKYKKINLLFYWVLYVLFWGLKGKNCNFLYKKIGFFFSCKILVSKTLDRLGGGEGWEFNNDFGLWILDTGTTRQSNPKKATAFYCLVQ
jgi:hypothetical protein